MNRIKRIVKGLHLNRGIGLVEVEAADFVQMLEKRQSIMISAPEEIGFRQGWITRDELLASAERYGKSPYGSHLRAVAEGKMTPEECWRRVMALNPFAE